MTKSDYEKLIQEIRQHDRYYYVDHRPLISDYAYDQLYQQLRQVELAHPEWVLPTSPTQRVGETLTHRFTQCSHLVPMLSLENTYNFDEVGEFLKRVYKILGKTSLPFCVELKMDGVALSVRYEKGAYARAVTRGDGRQGEDITANVRTLRSLPLLLSRAPEFLELRGEVFMPRQTFQRHNQQMEEPWANPRNAAAGSLKLLDPKEVAARGLCIVFYSLSGVEEVTRQHEVHSYLKQLGLPSFSKEHYTLVTDLQGIMAFAKTVEQQRGSLPFDIDGIVIKVDSLKLWPELGMTGRAPRWAVAYKFPARQAITRIRHITVQVGRTGVLTPVAELEPTLLEGSTIARATLHNGEEIRRKDVREGDVVVIEKGGDVIPKVVEVVLDNRSPYSRSWEMPLLCPSCHSQIVRREGEVALRCPDTKQCPEQLIAQILYFASRRAMNIDHLGEKVVRQLVEKKLIRTPSDLYLLTQEHLTQLDGYKHKSIHNLLFAIEASKRVSLSRLIVSLGIRYVGEETAEALAREVLDIRRMMHLSKEEFLQVEGVGEKVAEALVTYFADTDHVAVVESLLRCGVRPFVNHLVLLDGHPFSGKKFVVTGTLRQYTREEAHRLIQERGGKILRSVSKAVDYLIVGEEAGGKLRRAQALSIPLLTEEEFSERVGGSGKL